MLNLIINPKDAKGLKILCLGAHGDDLEIGCGGTILRLAEEYPDAKILWVVLSGNATRRKEIEQGALALLEGFAQKEVIVKNFRDSFFPYEGAAIKEFFEELKSKFQPDLIFTHYEHDAHQDHRLTNQLTWNSWRNHLILEYEVPKYDGDLGQPNFYVNLRENQVQKKISSLMECYPSQVSKHWFDEELFRGLMRIRGMESCSPSGYAEAFYCRKISF